MSRAPDPSSPPKPALVPAVARWNAGARAWSVGEWDGEGRAQGRHQVYGRDGALQSEQHYEHGQLEGEFVDLHPNAEVARRGTYRAGQLDGECVRYASTEASPQVLRTCCVPPGAWSMRSRFAAGRCLFEHFYDRQERRLLDDGTLFPPLPQHVPGHSHFDSKTRRWWVVEFDAQGQRHGDSSWWLESGELDERCGYVQGKRHGSWEKFGVGGLLRRAEYDQGVLHGSAFELTLEHEDPAIAQRRGQHLAGKPSGVWRFEAADGTCLYERDMGLPRQRLSADDFVGVSEHGAERPIGEPTVAVSLLRALRDVGHALWREGAEPGAHAERARELLHQAAPRLKPSVTDARIRALRNDSVDTWVRQSALLDLLMCGGTAVSVLREMGTYLIEVPELGLDMTSLAAAMAPERADVLASRALLALEAGQCELARSDIRVLAETQPEAAEQIEFARRVTFAPLDFTPSDMVFNHESAEELPSAVAQPLQAVHRTIAKLHKRLNEARTALARVPAIETQPEIRTFWPLQLSALSGLPAVELEEYSFSSEDDGESDTVVVAERLQLQGKRPSELIHRARLDWIALCWLCWGVGLEQVGVPDRVGARPDYARALGTAFTRAWRARDRLQSMGLLARKQGAPSFDWHGVSIDTLAPRWVHNVRDEYLEMRAALFFLGDSSCRSLWQDDLRV